jgi:hypothetical protein
VVDIVIKRAVVMLTLVWVSSCAMAPTMDKVAPQGVDLTGDWLLDRHVSDDVRARLAPIIEKKELRWRSVERRYEDHAPLLGPDAELTPEATLQGGPPEPSNMQWLQQQRHFAAEALIIFVSPAINLQIRQSTRQGRHEISVHTDKGEGTRVLVPGETSALFVSMGGFDLRSGWQKKHFVVDMRGTGDNAMIITQYYTVSDSGNELDMRMEAHIPEIGSQKFHFVYRRN